jgi:S-adenosylmethionine-dependent methyltransferase
MRVADDTSDIRQYYEDSVEKEDGRLERHQLERDMTWRYLDKYLPRQGKILEIGCATGAYTIPLAKRGYAVTAVDFAAAEVEVCKKKIKVEKLEEMVSCFVADGRDLSSITNNDYDAALVMGPFYHLVLEEDRKIALTQAYKHLKNGGLVFSTFTCRYGIWGDLMKNFPDHIDQAGRLEPIVTRGKQDIPFESWGKAFRAYFASPEEIPLLHEAAGLKTIALAGLETAGIRDEMYNSLQGKRRQKWLDLLFSISTQPSIVGASNHLLYVGKKTG